MTIPMALVSKYRGRPALRKHMLIKRGSNSREKYEIGCKKDRSNSKSCTIGLAQGCKKNKKFGLDHILTFLNSGRPLYSYFTARKNDFSTVLGWGVSSFRKYVCQKVIYQYLVWSSTRGRATVAIKLQAPQSSWQKDAPRAVWCVFQ